MVQWLLTMVLSLLFMLMMLIGQQICSGMMGYVKFENMISISGYGESCLSPFQNSRRENILKCSACGLFNTFFCRLQISGSTLLWLRLPHIFTANLYSIQLYYMHTQKHTAHILFVKTIHFTAALQVCANFKKGKLYFSKGVCFLGCLKNRVYQVS